VDAESEFPFAIRLGALQAASQENFVPLFLMLSSQQICRKWMKMKIDVNIGCRKSSQL